MKPDFQLELSNDEALALREALSHLPQAKKIANQEIVSKLIGSREIWPGQSINEIKGVLPKPGLAKLKEKMANEKPTSTGFNFIIETPFLQEADKEILFKEESAIVLKEDATMLDVLVVAKIFRSKGQARKNGWEKKQVIPFGWSEFVIGKRKHQVFIWKPDS